MADTGKYVGKWKMVSVSVFGMTEPLSVDNTIYINADGTAKMVSPEDEKAYIWKETDYGLFLDGKSDLKLTADGDKFTTKILGFITINIEKQD